MVQKMCHDQSYLLLLNDSKYSGNALYAAITKLVTKISTLTLRDMSTVNWQRSRIYRKRVSARGKAEITERAMGLSCGNTGLSVSRRTLIGGR